MNTEAGTYFTEGCGRCKFGGTPDCKVHKWKRELEQLRTIVLACGLEEECKWGVPCYTFQKKNVLILAAFKEYCAISFFKGALLNNAGGILEMPGENSQAARVIRFTDVKKIQQTTDMIRAHIFEAIEVEKAGLKPKFKISEEQFMPEEFKNSLSADPTLKTAFYALTPGRQKGYLLHFSAAKQSKTRESRIEKCIPQILKGRGLMD